MNALERLVAAELSAPVDPRVATLAEGIAARHGEASRAVLFYGSCLREQQLDGLMLDFYLIVSGYRAAYDKRWLAAANRLIPPNVFYFEAGGLRAKYAVLSEQDFRREVGLDARSTSVWARFAQPSRLAWVKDSATAETMAQIIQHAAPTLFQYTMPMMADPGRTHAIRDIWSRGFELTYEAELRAERGNRPSSIVDCDPERYEAFGQAVLEVGLAKSPNDVDRWWRRMRRKGKALSVLRLAKASATFAGGVDYIAWKINRHAGTEIRIKPWQRRWPLLAAISLLPRLLKSGAVR